MTEPASSSLAAVFSKPQPTLSIAMIVRNCADDLDRCLKSIRARPWGAEVEIVVVDTMSNDDGATVTVAEHYADKVVEYAGPNGSWTREMYAFDDAADARNHAFALATGRWVMWLDSDDELVSADEAERLLKLNGRFRVGAPSATATKVVGGDNTKPIDLPDLLRMLDQHPEGRKVTGFWAPYLYRFVDNDFERGMAMTWQIRERIVRNDGSWKWVRPAHEVLVPADPKAHNSMGDLSALLVCHRKVWDEAAAMYSILRHQKILQAAWDQGTRNCQDILYLDNYEWARKGSVARRRELLTAGLECAHTPVDKARVLARWGDLNKEQGYFMDAVASYAAAIEVCPQIGDFYFKIAEVYEGADWWPKACEWYLRGVAVPPAHPFSDLPPRDHLVLMRIRAALCAHRASKAALHVKNLDAADGYAQKAVELAIAAYKEPCIGPDKQDAQAWVGLFENELNALARAKNIFHLWEYLKNNDETEKAALLLRTVPHNLRDHPIVIEIEQWAVKLKKHFEDPQEYAEFYEAIGTDIQSDADELPGMLPRCAFAVDQLVAERQRVGRPLRILEVGPFDGITLIPLMRALPDCEFVGLEIKQDAADRLRERLRRLVPDVRSTIVHGQLADAEYVLTKEFQTSENAREEFDAVVFFEVIEHVPDVNDAIADLTRLVRPGGLLFVSTPWGAFDRGHQPMADTRDSRGHVRAMMPDELVRSVESPGQFIVETQAGGHAEGNYGDTMHLVARRLLVSEWKAKRYAARTPLQFVVPGALWPWNASHLIKTGMGASEETIVYLARELAKDPDNKAHVYGPLPKFFALDQEEVNGRVQYSPVGHLRRAELDAPIIVSRTPFYAKHMADTFGKAPMDATLWLQDATYPDLKEHWHRYKNIVVLSEWHKAVLNAACGVPVDRMTVVPNFLLAEHFSVAQVEKANEERAKALKDGEVRFLYASSPDRGLLELLNVWKHVIKEWPKAQLRIFYGWEGCMKLGAGDPGWVSRYREIREEYLRLKAQPGVFDFGRVNHAVIADQYRWAHVWPYVTAFGETFCSNAVKARAAGCVPVHSGVAALAETAACPEAVLVPYKQPGESSGDFLWRYFTGIQEAVYQVSDESRLRMAGESIETYEIASVLPIWKKILGL